jgi:hypothetical protein
MRSLSLNDVIELLPTATVVIAHNDPGIAQELANDLHPHSARVIVAEDVETLHTLLLRPEEQVAVLDLDFVKLEEVRQFSSTFCNLTIVCTHPAPDDRMWMAALDAGAVEFCHPEDIRSLLRDQVTA